MLISIKESLPNLSFFMWSPRVDFFRDVRKPAHTLSFFRVVIKDLGSSLRLKRQNRLIGALIKRGVIMIC